MRLVSYGPAGQERAGVLSGGHVIDIAAADPSLPDSVRSVLAADALDRVAALLESGEFRESAVKEVKSVRLGPPIPDPSKIICLGLNYRDHAAEQNKEPPGFPLLFSKGPNVLCGHKDVVPYPHITQEFDYEVELAFVIGRRARKIEPGTGYQYVAGYTVFLDLTARDLQYRERQWFRGKSIDGSGPAGPWLVTSDEISDPHALRISLAVNGETLQDSDTGQMTFTADFLVHHISQTMTLEPGDIVATGTPPGVGMFREPQRFLRPGDRLSASIESIGTLDCSIGP